MSETTHHDGAGWRVVRNAAGTHSVWPEGRTLPAGWQPVTSITPLDYEDALAAVATVWLDTRPAAVGSAS